MDHEGPPEGDLPWSTERDAVHAALTTGLACASIYGSDVDIVPPIDLASDPVQGEDVRRRVLHVGDSFVFGFGVRPSERFTSRLDGLEPRTSNLNAGVEATAPDVYLAVVRRWIALRRVDAVVMYLTFNDSSGRLMSRRCPARTTNLSSSIRQGEHHGCALPPPGLRGGSPIESSGC